MQPARLVVLASGMGSRLRSKTSPKPLVELGGISLVERALAGASQAGFDEVVVVTGHRADQIDRHVLEVSRRPGHRRDGGAQRAVSGGQRAVGVGGA